MRKMKRIPIFIIKIRQYKTSAAEVMRYVASGLYPAIGGSTPSCRI